MGYIGDYALKDIKFNKEKIFEEIVEEYSTRIIRICYIQTGDLQESEDLAQDVFIKIYKNLDKFKGDSSIYTWIYKITVNTCFSYLRKNKRDSWIELKDEHKSSEDVEESVILNISKKVLKEALYKTPQELRIVLYMYYFDGIKITEIAEILELNQNTVKTRLRRGKEYLKGYCGGKING